MTKEKQSVSTFEPPDELTRLAQVGHRLFMAEEARHRLPLWDVVLIQMKQIGKHWWVLQGVLLGLAWLVLSHETDVIAIRRFLAVIATLFSILVIPELWKNNRTKSIEIEMTVVYSLRYIYAIRLFIFAGVDVTLLTCFSAVTILSNQIALMDLVIQFVLPITITSTICVWLLGRSGTTERQAVFACLGWNLFWALVITHDGLYGLLSSPLLVFVLTAVLGVGLVLGLRVVHTSTLWRKEMGYAINA